MDLESEVQSVIDTLWNKRASKNVPETQNVALSGGAVEIEATFLYADLANSSKMAKELDIRIAAKILKSFHLTACKIIKQHGGIIQSFDGDRVMGVFTGGTKNTSAVKSALKINYAVQKIIKPKFEKKYETVRNASFSIQHGTGLDTGKILTVRAGAHGNNDLIWIGRAPNLAAKLSDVRSSPYYTHITASVYNKLLDSAKYGGKDDRHMWESCNWKFLNQNISVYRSSWHWKP